MLVAAPARGQVPLWWVRCGISVGHRSRGRSSAAGPPTASRSRRRPTPRAPSCSTARASASARDRLPILRAGAPGRRDPSEPVVAIVRRYQALSADAPSPHDLENLPYAHVESAIALRPFTLLAQSSAPYPGSSLSDRGLSPSRFAARSMTERRTTTSLTASRRTLSYRPTTSRARSCTTRPTRSPTETRPAEASSRSTRFGRARMPRSRRSAATRSCARRSDPTPSGIVARIVQQQQESRQRTDLFASLPLPADQSFDVTAGTEQGRDYQSPGSSFAGSFSFGNATFNDPARPELADLGDRRSRRLRDERVRVSDLLSWSDSGFAAGIHTTGPVSGLPTSRCARRPDSTTRRRYR